MSSLFTLPKQVPLSSGGDLLPGAKLYFFQTGTTTPQDTYTDIGLTVAHANPVEADAAGVFPPIYLDPEFANYRARLTTSSDVQVWQLDDIPSHQNSTQSIRLSDDSPSIILINNNASSNNKKIKISSDPSGAFLVSLLNDAESAQTDVITFGRSANTPTGVRIDDDLFSNDYRVFSGASALKPSSNTRTTTTLSADPHLALTVRTAGRYRLELFLKFHGEVTGTQGIQFSLQVTGGTALMMATAGVQSINGTGGVHFTDALSAFDRATISTSGDHIYISQIMTCTPSATMQMSLFWAQDSASANGTTLEEGSAMVLTDLGE